MCFSHTSPNRSGRGNFVAPVDAPVSDVFGTRRTFNGKVQSMHQGLDFAVPKGTPVFAVNAGTVLLASPLYFEGNCVVLDHGQGLLTLYLHLSEIKVKAGRAGRERPGDRIERRHRPRDRAAFASGGSLGRRLSEPRNPVDSQTALDVLSSLSLGHSFTTPCHPEFFLSRRGESKASESRFASPGSGPGGADSSRALPGLRRPRCNCLWLPPER